MSKKAKAYGTSSAVYDSRPKPSLDESSVLKQPIASLKKNPITKSDPRNPNMYYVTLQQVT